ncbi:galactose oxidase [Meridianimaribacter sp. CL38]|uniref:Kelch repeat-containing protein n=1 Tax=Meridianimaribacter sp. CL38 TaxID=2213021 RepID=UPI00103FAC65|nr:kelch repeat-containing protein [Meridianimaribacter sp. CL38]TBV26241.1 galactose oxidase [Meridianimaribacter sp. CL38]
MRNFLRLNILCALSCVLCVSCSDDDNDDLIGNWVAKSTFNGSARANSAFFTIGTKGYMGTGYDSDDYLKDFWVYDMETNFWQQKADFPGLERSSAIGFAIDNTGYIGTGYNGDINDELEDFYKYNADTNTWEQIADFGGGVRRGAIGFASSTNGYVGTGYNGSNDQKDFWKYNPLQDQWEEIAGFGGEKRRDATSFVIGDTAYIATGISNGIYQEDFWAFDLSTESWTELSDLEDDDDYEITRSASVGFTIMGKGYIACGENYGAINTVWEYDPSTDKWIERTEFELLDRQNPVVFNDGLRAFVALGRNGTYYLDDNMEFFPTQEQDDDDN